MIARDIFPNIWHWIGKKKILLLKGSRQVGKTTLLHALKSALEKEGKRTLYFSIDQELGNPIFQNSKNLGRWLEDQYPDLSERKKLFLFLDEFQYLAESGLFLKTLFDRFQDKIQIIASGSSSLEIRKNSEYLTGRKIEFSLYPFTWREFLRHTAKLALPAPLPLSKFKTLQEFYETYKGYLEEALLPYISFGGYPEVVTTRAHKDKEILLRELVRTYIEKDIIAFLRIENVNGFQSLLKILCVQIGNLVNKSELSNTVNLSMDTLSKYLDILEGTYVIEHLQPFFTNARKQLSKMPKVFVNDFGLRNIVLNQHLPLTSVSGAERENFVYNTLKTVYGKGCVKFYRTISKAEIDFILDLPGQRIPIEVKSIKKEAAPSRVFRDFSDGNGLVITDGYLAKKGEIFYIPLTLLPFVKIDN